MDHLIETDNSNDDDINNELVGYPLNLSVTLRSAKYMIVKKSIQFLGLFYLVIGIIIAFAYCCVSLDVKSVEEGKTNLFWEPCTGIFSIFNICVFVLTICHQYYRKSNNISNYKLHNLTNKYTTYAILIPLYLISLLFLTIFVARDIMMVKCYGYITFSLFVSVILLKTSTLFLINTMCFKGTPECNIYIRFKSEAADLMIIFFTIIGLLNVLIYNLFIQHIILFIHESKNSSYGYHFQLNKSCIINSTIGHQLQQIVYDYSTYFRPVLVLFCIFLISYLVQPLIIKIKFLIETETKYLKQKIIVKYSEDKIVNKIIDQNPSFRLPSLSLVICLTLLSLSFLAVLIMINFNRKSHVNFKSRMIFLILNLFIHFIGTPLTIKYIEGVTKWPPFKNHNGKFTDYCILWIGASGQLIKTITMFSYAIDSIYYDKKIDMNVLIIITSLLACFQSYFQTILLNYILETKWQKPKQNSWLESLCPAVGMLGLNVGLIVICVYETKLVDMNNKFFMDLFLQCMTSFGDIMVTLQRLHAILMFANIIIHTHN